MKPRLLAPVAVAAVLAAATVVAHLPGDPPALPRKSPVALAEKIASVDAIRFSGTVRLSVDVGLPRLPTLGTAGGADPLRLLSGEHTVRVATDTTGGADRQRVALLDTMSEYDAVRNGEDLWLWDSTRQLARHGSVNALTAALLSFATPADLVRMFTGPAAIQTAVFNTGLGSAKTTRVAGRDCYVLQIQPRQSGATIGEISVAVDAETGMPLRVAVYPAGSAEVAVSATFTQLAYSAPDDEFRFVPPPGAKVVEEPVARVGGKPFSGGGRGWTAATCLSGFDPRAAIAGLADGPGTADGPTPDDTSQSTGQGTGTASVLTALAGTPGTPLQSYLRMMLTAGAQTPAGLVWSSRLISVLFTPDSRLCVAFATPASLVATVEAIRPAAAAPGGTG